jgi:hypothetical protein
VEDDEINSSDIKRICIAVQKLIFEFVGTAENYLDLVNFVKISKCSVGSTAQATYLSCNEINENNYKGASTQKPWLRH